MDTRTFRTPFGAELRVLCREDTNDAMVAESVIVHDEYGLTKRPYADGVGVDVGAHIGTWTLAFLALRPESRAIAVEPLPANVELLEQNLALNGMTDRCTVIQGALSKGRGLVTIGWDFQPGSPAEESMARMHRFIGNQTMPATVTNGDIVESDPVSVAALVKEAGGSIAIMKLDAEGAERALIGASLVKVEVIVGEYHTPWAPLRAHLRKTHTVERDGSDTFGSFSAVRK